MGAISGYVTTLFVICTCGALCELILSGTSRQSKTLENGLKLIISLCVCISVLIPASKSLKSFDTSTLIPKVETYGMTSGDSYVLNLTKKDLEKRVSEKIYVKTGIHPASVCINFVMEQKDGETNVNFGSAQIFIHSSDKKKADDVLEYSKELLGCDVTVEVSGG